SGSTSPAVAGLRAPLARSGAAARNLPSRPHPRPVRIAAPARRQAAMRDTFGTLSPLRVGAREYRIFRLEALEARGMSVSRLPYTLRILLENLLRHEDGASVSAQDVEALARWRADGLHSEISFMPARVLLQDFTGVPALVDLAAMRTAMADLGGDPARINPQLPVELIVDHSVQVDAFASPRALDINQDRDYERNGERYAFLKWGQNAFSNF